MSVIRVLVVDDHAIVRDGIRALLGRSEDIEVVGEAGGGRDAITLASTLSPDVILMDIAMADLGGLEATLEIRKDHPGSKIIVLSQYSDPEYVKRALKSGVSGYVLKKAAGADLVSAIHAVHRGGLVLDPDVARDAITGDAATADVVAAQDDPYERLTDREKQVLKLVAEGRSNKDVAELLGISVKTAMSHREHVMVKLRAHNRTDVIRFALRHGVIRADP
jgi:DNA-binding NarL/FixJ family response regulator